MGIPIGAEEDGNLVVDGSKNTGLGRKGTKKLVRFW